ncbi:MAG: hypothetical protein ACRELD_16940, partial [Longimicrobiales bacterium]
MDERPVTGSCEQCGRGYELRIPAPGSADLQFRRIERVFRWCVGCGMFVGRRCCWDPAAAACARCAAASPISDARAPAFGDPIAAHAAIGELDAAIAALAELEESLELDADADREQALDAWEDAWLATGALIARVESCRVAAASRLQDLSPLAEEPVRELSAALRPLLATYETRWRSVARRLAGAGRRIAERTRTSGGPEPTRAASIVAGVRAAGRAPAAPPGRAMKTEPQVATTLDAASPAPSLSP